MAKDHLHPEEVLKDVMDALSENNESKKSKEYEQKTEDNGDYRAL